MLHLAFQLSLLHALTYGCDLNSVRSPWFPGLQFGIPHPEDRPYPIQGSHFSSLLSKDLLFSTAPSVNSGHHNLLCQEPTSLDTFWHPLNRPTFPELRSTVHSTLSNMLVTLSPTGVSGSEDKGILHRQNLVLHRNG